jgi:MoxR-like ATPase
VFHYISFPTADLMEDIVRVHFPDVESKLLAQAMARFYRLRDIDTLRKKPSTSELLDWIAALRHGGIDPELLTTEIPFIGALLKTESDMTQIQTIVGRS